MTNQNTPYTQRPVPVPKATMEHVYLLRIPDELKQKMTQAGIAWGQFKTGKVRQFILDAITEKLERKNGRSVRGLHIPEAGNRMDHNPEITNNPPERNHDHELQVQRQNLFPRPQRRG